MSLSLTLSWVLGFLSRIGRDVITHTHSRIRLQQERTADDTRVRSVFVCVAVVTLSATWCLCWLCQETVINILVSILTWSRWMDGWNLDEWVDGWVDFAKDSKRWHHWNVIGQMLWQLENQAEWCQFCPSFLYSLWNRLWKSEGVGLSSQETVSHSNKCVCCKVAQRGRNRELHHLHRISHICALSNKCCVLVCLCVCVRICVYVCVTVPVCVSLYVCVCVSLSVCVLVCVFCDFFFFLPGSGSNSSLSSLICFYSKPPLLSLSPFLLYYSLPFFPTHFLSFLLFIVSSFVFSPWFLFLYFLYLFFYFSFFPPFSSCYFVFLLTSSSSLSHPHPLFDFVTISSLLPSFPFTSPLLSILSYFPSFLPPSSFPSTSATAADWDWSGALHCGKLEVGGCGKLSR